MLSKFLRQQLSATRPRAQVARGRDGLGTSMATKSKTEEYGVGKISLYKLSLALIASELQRKG
jgi:hypothetical protein